MSTNRSFEDVIEWMLNADDGYEYTQAIMAYDEFNEVEFYYAVPRCLPLVLCQMHRDQDNERLQKRGRDVLYQIHLSFWHYDYDNPVFDEIVEFIELHREDASAARLGFELCHELYHNECIPPDMSQNSANVAVDSMIRHENDPVVQKYAILFLSYGRRNLEIDINDPNVLRLCIQVMRNHPDNSDVQAAACNAIYVFRDKYELIISVEWPPLTILQALSNHVHCAEVQESACDCLGYLLEGVRKGFCLRGRDYFEANLPTLGGEELFLAGQDYIEAVLQAMQTHLTNEKVQCAALHILDRMLYESASLNLIIQGGGVHLIIRAMRTFEWEEMLCHRAVMILRPLFGCSAGARREAIELGAIPLLLYVLRRRSLDCFYWQSSDLHNKSWCVMVCDALNKLFLENIDNTVGLQIANEGGIELIIDWIGNYVRPNSYRTCERLELKDGDILAHLAMFSADDGKLPLHYAADRGHFYSAEGRMAVLEHLLKVYPEAATVRDGSGRLPLHIAIGWRAPPSVLEMLLHANPDAGEAVCRCPDDIMLNFPPGLMAAASDCDLECIFALLRYAPSIMKRQVTFAHEPKMKVTTAVEPFFFRKQPELFLAVDWSRRTYQ